MKNKITLLARFSVSERAAKRAKYALSVAGAIAVMVGVQVWASNQSQLNQTINEGTLSVDIVDSGGTTVGSPSVTFGALTFDFDTQDGSGTLGTASERIRVYNPTSTAAWSVTLAGSATTATWTDGGSNKYDFNDGSGYTDGGDTDSFGGQMTVDPSGGTLNGVGSCTTTNVSLGSSDSYEEGTTDSIDLVTAASGADTFCRWDLTGVSLSQGIPAGQAAASYSLTMVLTVS